MRQIKVGAILTLLATSIIPEVTQGQLPPLDSIDGHIKGSIRSTIGGKDHYYLANPLGPEGHFHVSINSLGISPLTPTQVMGAVKSTFRIVFPYFGLSGDCGMLKAKNRYSLGAFPVRVAYTNSVFFRLETLPWHLLKGSAIHGIVKDDTGELWLFQVGSGVIGEWYIRQGFNNFSAELMWNEMAENIKRLMKIIASDSTAENVGLTFSVNKTVDTGISLCPGDSVIVAAKGVISVTNSGLETNPDGLDYPQLSSFNFPHASRCNHGSLLLAITNDSLPEYVCVGSSGTVSLPGLVSLLVNDWHQENNRGEFRVTLRVKQK